MGARTQPRPVTDLLDALAATGPRKPGSDAERRAAQLMASELRDERRTATLETFWCRPNWALAQAWHVALGIAGSLLAVDHARLGGAIILGALLAVLADALSGISPGRRLTPERASQNVVSRPRTTSATATVTTTATATTSATASAADTPFHLLLTANLDAGRTAYAFRNGIRGRTTRLRHRATGGRAPGWQAWILIALLWTLVTALVRLKYPHSTAISTLQLPPTVGLLLALALLLELAGAQTGPGASDNGTGVALALAVAHALDAAPPSHASVEVVLTGAGDGQGIGLRRHLRTRRQELKAANTIVLGLGPIGAGDPAFLLSDGPLAPLAFSRRLTALGQEVAEADPKLGLRAERTRGVSPALPARAASLPAITIAGLARDGTAPRSHDPEDVPENVDLDTFGRALRTVLLLVDGIDDELGSL